MDVAEVFVMEFDLDADLLGDAERFRDARVIDIEPYGAADQGEVGAVAASGGFRKKRTVVGSSSRISRATRPSRAVPAVCELDGPTITGPITSRIETLRSCRTVISRLARRAIVRPRDILYTAPLDAK